MHYALHSLYRSSTRVPEDDSVESKHVATLSHYMLNITTVVFDGPSPPTPLLFHKYFGMEHLKFKYVTEDSEKDWMYVAKDGEQE